jgi:hypothetical protein
MKKISYFLSLLLGLSLGIFSCGPATETSTTDTEVSTSFGGLALYTVRDSMASNLAFVSILKESLKRHGLSPFHVNLV